MSSTIGKIQWGIGFIPKYRQRILSSTFPSIKHFKGVNLVEKLPLHNSSYRRKKWAKVDAGEDAFFNLSTPFGGYIGVADGVGGWEDVGVDSSHFSWTLMTNCNDILKEKLSLNDYNITHNPTPQQLLDLSYKRLIDSKNVMAGSSTASIVQFDKVNSLLNTCNLGDSGYIIIRNFNQIVYKSKPMHHFFNCPYQLSLSPEDAKKGLNSSDSVSDSQTSQHKLYPNDLVIVATDGLFDNLFDEETLSIVQNEFINISPNMGDSYSNSIHFSNNENYDPTLLAGDSRLDQKVRKLAQKLTDTARRLSYNKKRMSPWAQYAIENGYPEEIGGKVDDITVLVALVQPTAE